MKEASCLPARRGDICGQRRTFSLDIIFNLIIMFISRVAHTSYSQKCNKLLERSGNVDVVGDFAQYWLLHVVTLKVMLS